MRLNSLKIMMMVVGLAFVAGLTLAAEPIRYAVLAFEGSGGITTPEAEAMADRCAETLARMGPFKVVDRRQAAAILPRAGIQVGGPLLPGAAVREAGQVLGVDYAITGQVFREGGKSVLLTTLLEIRSGEIVRRVRTDFPGAYATFLELGPSDNLKTLLLEFMNAGAGVTRAPVGDPGRPGQKPGEKPWYEKNIDWREVGETTMGLLAGRVEVGTRMTHFMLTKPHDSDRFVGYIDRLTEEQDYSPVERRFWLPANWFISYKITREWGVDLSWNKLRAETHNGDSGPSDGAFLLEGPIFSGFWRYINPSPWTPYAGMGLAFYDGDFDHEGWWANGYATPADYEALGPEPRNGKTRWMSLDDCWGYAFYAGTDVNLWKSLCADLLVRYVQVEGDVSYGSKMGNNPLYEKGPYNVPFSHVAWSLGVKWEF